MERRVGGGKRRTESPPRPPRGAKSEALPSDYEAARRTDFPRHERPPASNRHRQQFACQSQLACELLCAEFMPEIYLREPQYTVLTYPAHTPYGAFVVGQEPYRYLGDIEWRNFLHEMTISYFYRCPWWAGIAMQQVNQVMVMNHCQWCRFRCGFPDQFSVYEEESI